MRRTSTSAERKAAGQTLHEVLAQNRLRRELKRRLEAEGRPVPGKPSQSALYDDLAEISGASAAGN